MALADFAALLRDSIGLDAASIGSEAIARAVQARQSACDLTDQDAYWRRAWTSETERQELIESVVVPETWFFRDRAAFSTLAQVACQEWLPARPAGVLRILSLPCSTGEEPYSIAMALLDAGVPAARFRIDAIDISVRAIQRAQRGVYGKNSFRGEDLAFRARHFDATPAGYSLNERVRRQVRFERGNVFAADAVPGAAASYDAVFCRNLLIYFDRDGQNRAVRVIERLLTPDGALFVAPSETALPIDHNFVSLKAPQAFGFRKVDPAAREAARKPVAVVPPRPAIVRPRQRIVAPPVAAAPPPQETERIALTDAAKLADQGLFDEAIASCEAHLRESGPSAEAFRLLGVVRDARGDASEAVACYRKALYLDPNQLDVMLHMALLMDRLNKPEDAQVLRNRARRLETHGGKDEKGGAA